MVRKKYNKKKKGGVNKEDAMTNWGRKCRGNEIFCSRVKAPVWYWCGLSGSEWKRVLEALQSTGDFFTTHILYTI